MRTLLLLIIKFYRYFLSPLLASRCRFYPSCSAYALQAINRHGVMQGGWLALKRLLRCHPWHESGYDPLPNDGAYCAHSSIELASKPQQTQPITKHSL